MLHITRDHRLWFIVHRDHDKNDRYWILKYRVLYLGSTVASATSIIVGRYIRKWYSLCYMGHLIWISRKDSNWNVFKESWRTKSFSCYHWQQLYPENAKSKARGRRTNMGMYSSLFREEKSHWSFKEYYYSKGYYTIIVYWDFLSPWIWLWRLKNNLTWTCLIYNSLHDNVSGLLLYFKL